MRGLRTDYFCSDLQHHSFKVMLDGKLNLAPISNPKRVLDLATGTGIWAIEFGTSPLSEFFSC
jgi:ubiquinone/menaquinone biosynthesis C-methylase UbiE